MQKTVKAERPRYTVSYYPGRLPAIAGAVLFLLLTVCILSLRLDFPLQIVFLVMLAMLLLWQVGIYYSCRVEALSHDGNGWSLWLPDDKSIIVDVLPSSFLSSFLLVLVLREAEGKRCFHLCLSRHNCAEYDFRVLCRFLRLGAA